MISATINREATATMWTKVIVKTAVTAGTVSLIAAGLAAPASAGTPSFTAGEKSSVIYNNSPLRTCADTSCTVLAYMPKTTSLQPGGGYVTFAKDQSGPNWCEINWRNIIGWTGCWRLDPGSGTTGIG
jgi:hypothetical protein